MSKIIIIALATILLCIIFGYQTIQAEDEGVQILYVNAGQPNMIGNLQMNYYEAAIYSPVEQRAVITMYVQDQFDTPVGVLIFKTTLLAGITPLEYSFTVPNECAYNSMVHGMICSADFEKTIYVNVFTNSQFTQPMTDEYEMMI